MSEFDDIYRRFHGEGAPALEAPATGEASFQALYDRLHPPTATEPVTMVAPAAHTLGGAPFGGVTVTTTPVSEGDKAVAEIATKAALQKASAVNLSGEGFSGQGSKPAMSRDDLSANAGYKLGLRDLEGGIEKIVGYTPSQEDQDYQKQLIAQSNLTPGGGSVGRILGQLTGVLPAAKLTNMGLRVLPVAGNFLTGGAGGNALVRTMSAGTQGAIQGGQAAALTSGQSEDPLADQTLSGVKWGAALPIGLTALSGGGRGAARTLAGDPEVARLADLAVNKYGLNSLRASQVTENNLVRKADQISGQMPFSGAGQAEGGLRSEFTRAVSRTFGQDVDRLTPTVTRRAQRQLGSTLESIETGHNVDLTPAIPKFSAIQQRYLAELPDTNEHRVLDEALNTIFNNVQSGTGQITGTTFGNLIHKGSRLDNLTNSSNRNIAAFASDIKSTLRDALQASLPADAAALYQQTRGQYHNLMAVLPLVNNAPVGRISPVALNNAVTNSFGRRERALYGAGDLDELARIGQQFLKEPKDSNTPMGLAMQNLLTSPGKIAALAFGGSGAAYAAGYNPLGSLGVTPEEMLIATPATLAANRLLRMPMNSTMARNALIRAGTGAPPNAGSNAFMQYGPAVLGSEVNQPPLLQNNPNR